MRISFVRFRRRKKNKMYEHRQFRQEIGGFFVRKKEASETFKIISCRDCEVGSIMIN